MCISGKLGKSLITKMQFEKKIRSVLALNIFFTIYIYIYVCMFSMYVYIYIYIYRGITHRDIKPENILLSSPADDTDIKLADFGAACWSRQRGSARMRSYVGSPQVSFVVDSSPPLDMVF